MNQQLDMFAEPLLPFQGGKPAVQARARNSDPLSSHAAAARMNAGGEAHNQRQRCIDLVWMHPGKTSKELAELGGMDRHAVARRLPEAAESGEIAARCEGAKEKTWWPAQG